MGVRLDTEKLKQHGPLQIIGIDFPAPKVPSNTQQLAAAAFNSGLSSPYGGEDGLALLVTLTTALKDAYSKICQELTKTIAKNKTSPRVEINKPPLDLGGVLQKATKNTLALVSSASNLFMALSYFTSSGKTDLGIVAIPDSGIAVAFSAVCLWGQYELSQAKNRWAAPAALGVGISIAAAYGLAAETPSILASWGFSVLTTVSFTANLYTALSILQEHSYKKVRHTREKIDKAQRVGKAVLLGTIPPLLAVANYAQQAFSFGSSTIDNLVSGSLGVALGAIQCKFIDKRLGMASMMAAGVMAGLRELPLLADYSSYIGAMISTVSGATMARIVYAGLTRLQSLDETRKYERVSETYASIVGGLRSFYQESKRTFGVAFLMGSLSVGASMYGFYSLVVRSVGVQNQVTKKQGEFLNKNSEVVEQIRRGLNSGLSQRAVVVLDKETKGQAGSNQSGFGKYSVDKTAELNEMKFPNNTPPTTTPIEPDGRLRPEVVKAELNSAGGLLETASIKRWVEQMPQEGSWGHEILVKEAKNKLSWLNYQNRAAFMLLKFAGPVNSDELNQRVLEVIATRNRAQLAKIAEDLKLRLDYAFKREFVADVDKQELEAARQAGGKALKIETPDISIKVNYDTNMKIDRLTRGQQVAAWIDSLGKGNEKYGKTLFTLICIGALIGGALGEVGDKAFNLSYRALYYARRSLRSCQRGAVIGIYNLMGKDVPNDLLNPYRRSNTEEQGIFDRIKQLPRKCLELVVAAYDETKDGPFKIRTDLYPDSPKPYLERVKIAMARAAIGRLEIYEHQKAEAERGENKLKEQIGFFASKYTDIILSSFEQCGVLFDETSKEQLNNSIKRKIDSYLTEEINRLNTEALDGPSTDSLFKKMAWKVTNWFHDLVASEQHPEIKRLNISRYSFQSLLKDPDLANQIFLTALPVERLIDLVSQVVQDQKTTDLTDKLTRIFQDS